jgi:prepilin-type N-terminal cleavage/methylation domain-containing protein
VRVRPLFRRVAFSLLELLICIAIIALLASILLTVVVKVLHFVRAVVERANG